MSKNNKRATIYDIARKVKTSTATVSRVLSHSGYPVSIELKNKILLASKELNYIPNIVGRMLKKSDSKDIGVIVPTILNPYYTQLVLGIEQEARNKGYNIFLCNSLRDPITEEKYIDSLFQKQVSGIIISSVTENHEYLKKRIKQGLNVVVFDQDIVEIKGSKVGFDYIKGGLIAVEYLIKMGHKNIAFLTTPLNKQSRRETLEGYRLALLKNNIDFIKENIIESESEIESADRSYEFENGKYLAKKFLSLKERPTAIFAINDMTAFGIIQEFLEKGIKVPEDISIIGFDNIEFSTMITPPLTTVNQPSYETGKHACKLLLEKMEDEKFKDISITLQPSLIIRKSVKSLE